MFEETSHQLFGLIYRHNIKSMHLLFRSWVRSLAASHRHCSAAKHNGHLSLRSKSWREDLSDGWDGDGSDQLVLRSSRWTVWQLLRGLALPTSTFSHTKQTTWGSRHFHVGFNVCLRRDYVQRKWKTRASVWMKSWSPSSLFNIKTIQPWSGLTRGPSTPMAGCTSSPTEPTSCWPERWTSLAVKAPISTSWEFTWMISPTFDNTGIEWASFEGCGVVRVKITLLVMLHVTSPAMFKYCVWSESTRLSKNTINRLLPREKLTLLPLFLTLWCLPLAKPYASKCLFE